MCIRLNSFVVNSVDFIEENFMELLIVTGMSGSGKTTALNMLEDMGYYSIDNFPINMFKPFLNLLKQEGSKKKLALTIDVRNFDLETDLEAMIDFLRIKKINYSIMFIDANKESLLRRYKETRRSHPLMVKEGLTLEEAIDKEKDYLNYLRGESDYLIDTSDKLVVDFKEWIINMVGESMDTDMAINFVSFGFKYGALVDADLLFDLRCLPNPYYQLDLRPKTGEDQVVEDYVMSFDQAKGLYDKINDYLEFSVPLYKKEGKSQLIVGIGCTGGKHRSVTFVKKFFEDFQAEGIRKIKRHRDIKKV